jgi:PTS system nitrogen regulatory IIA component
MLLQPEQHSTEWQVPARIVEFDDGAPKMVIRDFLSPSDALIAVRASDKRRLLQDLASRAAAALDLPADRIGSELLRREELGSTGTGGGIAIPHARMSGIKKPFGMLVRLKQPIAFDAIDDQPVEIVFLLLLPAASAGEQPPRLRSWPASSGTRQPFVVCVGPAMLPSSTAMVTEDSS